MPVHPLQFRFECAAGCRDTLYNNSNLAVGAHLCDSIICRALDLRQHNLQVSLSATQQLCAAGALVSLLHREGAISAQLGDAETGGSPLIAIDSIREVRVWQQPCWAEQGHHFREGCYVPCPYCMQNHLISANVKQL